MKLVRCLPVESPGSAGAAQGGPAFNRVSRYASVAVEALRMVAKSSAPNITVLPYAPGRCILPQPIAGRARRALVAWHRAFDVQIVRSQGPGAAGSMTLLSQEYRCILGASGNG